MYDFISHNKIQIVFIICALLGGVMHYLKKYLKGETDNKIYEWFGTSNITATIYTIIVFFFAIVGAIAANVVNEQTGFWAAMYSGFVTGFAIDAGFNGDQSNMAGDLARVKTDLKTIFDRSETKPDTKSKEDVAKPKAPLYRPKQNI